MTSNPLLAPIVPLRRVDPPEAPCPGVLVRITDDIWQLVALDGRRFGAVGVDARGAEHIWTPHDYVLHDGLRAAVLPWCTGPLGERLGRFDVGELPGGTAVTVLVSLIRGLQEARRIGTGARPLPATWWITDTGRPLLVPAEGSDTVSETVGLIDLVRARIDDPDLHRIVDAVAETCRGVDTDAREWETLERRLFECYAPQPITRPSPVILPGADATAPVSGFSAGDPAPAPSGRTGFVERRGAHARREKTAAQRVSSSGRRRGAHVRALAAHLRMRFRRAPRGGGGRLSRPAGARHGRGLRRAPLVVAAGAAALVLAAGLMWPTGTDKRGAIESGSARIAARSGDDPASGPATTHDPTHARSPLVIPRPSVAPSPSPARSPTVTRSPTPAWSPTPGVPGPPRGGRTASSAGADDAAAGAASQAPAAGMRADPVAAVTALLANGRTCVPGPSCEARLTGRVGTATIPVPARVTLVDDYGGVAAVRVATGAYEAIVVVELREERWRVRDVQNVTDPPKE